jgi:hypothetical protein
MITALEALALIKFTPTEEHALAKLEAVVDGLIFEHFDGSPFSLSLADFISPKLAAALQRRFESRAFNDSAFWQVAYKPIEGEVGKDQRYAFSFSPMVLPEVPKADTKEKERPLPPVTVATVQVPAAGTRRLLVRMPTRGRPAQAIEVLTQYRVRAGMPITIEVVIDEDDEQMMAAEVIQRLYALGCIITVGRHKSKVEAVNGGRRDLEWDVLLLASDDMVPVVDSYAVRVMHAMEEHFPQLDGAVYFADGYANERLVTLPIIGKRLYAQFGYVYHSDYKSLVCDQEQMDVFVEMNRLKYVDEQIIEHRHWVVGAKKDATYERNDALYGADKETYERRKVDKFGLPPLDFSVLICSLPSRKAQKDRLLDYLWSQITTFTRGFHSRIEVIVDDREAITIGEKRQSLLERARGKYIAFIDDDDWVSYDYVQRIVRSIANDADPDCLSLAGVMTTAGSSPEMFYNSIAHKEWYSKDRVHYRCPTHLSPVRRTLALKAGFPAVSHAEDYQYSSRLRELLKTEASTGPKALYYYYYWPTKKAKESL